MMLGLYYLFNTMVANWITLFIFANVGNDPCAASSVTLRKLMERRANEPAVANTMTYKETENNVRKAIEHEWAVLRRKKALKRNYNKGRRVKRNADYYDYDYKSVPFYRTDKLKRKSHGPPVTMDSSKIQQVIEDLDSTDKHSKSDFSALYPDRFIRETWDDDDYDDNNNGDDDNDDVDDDDDDNYNGDDDDDSNDDDEDTSDDDNDDDTGDYYSVDYAYYDNDIEEEDVKPRKTIKARKTIKVISPETKEKTKKNHAMLEDKIFSINTGGPAESDPSTGEFSGVYPNIGGLSGVYQTNDGGQNGIYPNVGAPIGTYPNNQGLDGVYPNVGGQSGVYPNVGPSSYVYSNVGAPSGVYPNMPRKSGVRPNIGGPRDVYPNSGGPMVGYRMFGPRPPLQLPTNSRPPVGLYNSPSQNNPTIVYYRPEGLKRLNSPFLLNSAKLAEDDEDDEEDESEEKQQKKEEMHAFSKILEDILDQVTEQKELDAQDARIELNNPRKANVKATKRESSKGNELQSGLRKSATKREQKELDAQEARIELNNPRKANVKAIKRESSKGNELQSGLRKSATKRVHA